MFLLMNEPESAMTQTTGLRHPLDPDVTRSTKAVAVFALGVAAAITGALVGGVIPATVALLLAKSTRAEMIAARGYLTGAPLLRAGVRLAWAGIVLAVAAVVVASIVGILHLATVSNAPQHFAPGTD
jgi:hydroxylaminobenzene mutase